MKNKLLTLLLVALGWHNQVFSQIYVTSSTTWDAPTFNSTPPSFGTWNSTTNTLTLASTVVVEHVSNKVVLTIDGIIVEFADATQVVAREGHEVHVINCSLIAENDYWLGIHGVGIPTIEQFATNIPEKYEAYNGSTTYEIDQTMILVESSFIENAQIGVTSDIGAILRITGTSFRDCMIGVQIKNYTHPNIGPTEMFNRNASYIENCDFDVYVIKNFSTTNNDFTYYRMIELKEVYGVHIQGCEFKNNDMNQRNCGTREIGILAENAQFSIHQSGAATQDPISGCVTYDGFVNRFEALSKGIYCYEVGGSSLRTSNSVASSNFLQCELSIHADGNYRMCITDNNADLSYIDGYASSATSCNGGYQIVLLEAVEEFVIQRNMFDCQALSTYPQPITMVRIDDCGTRDNKIYKNDFRNLAPDKFNATVVTGIELQNNNSQIEIWCNSFIQCRYGITITTGSTIDQTWRNDLGGTWVVGNSFSGTTDRLRDLNNLTPSTITYYETTGKWNTIIKFGSWNFIHYGTEATCSDLPCTEWPIGVGIKDYKSGSIKAYPNPATSEETITIDLERPLTGRITVYDIMGRVEGTYDFIESANPEISNHNLKPGVHIFVIEHYSEEKTSFKLIIAE